MTWPPHQMTWHASKQVTSPPWNSRRLVHSKEMVWALRWSVELRTFYRQILSLLYSSFFLWNFRARLARELLVYIYIFMIQIRYNIFVKTLPPEVITVYKMNSSRKTPSPLLRALPAYYVLAVSKIHHLAEGQCSQRSGPVATAQGPHFLRLCRRLAETPSLKTRIFTVAVRASFKMHVKTHVTQTLTHGTAKRQEESNISFGFLSRHALFFLLTMVKHLTSMVTSHKLWCQHCYMNLWQRPFPARPHLSTCALAIFLLQDCRCSFRHQLAQKKGQGTHV